jgi:hypothetical protein
MSRSREPGLESLATVPRQQMLKVSPRAMAISRKKETVEVIGRPNEKDKVLKEDWELL